MGSPVPTAGALGSGILSGVHIFDPCITDIIHPVCASTSVPKTTTRSSAASTGTSKWIPPFYLATKDKKRSPQEKRRYKAMIRELHYYTPPDTESEEEMEYDIFGD